MFKWVGSTVLLLSLVAWVEADNWPALRGPGGEGRSSETGLPVKWTAENVRWKVDLPGPGHSSPIVWGDRIFVTQALDRNGTRRALLCFDRANGKLLWQRETLYKQREPSQKANPYCSATPVTDGGVVIACFASAGLVCYDFQGNEKWRKELGKVYHDFGNASSPVLHGDLCIQYCGPGQVHYLLAVNKRTGEEVWKVNFPGVGTGAGTPASWSTPLVTRVGDRDELIVALPNMIKAFDPQTGNELWRCSGAADRTAATPAISKDGIVLATGSHGGATVAVRAGGKGDVTSKRLWVHNTKNPKRFGSPVIVGDHAYVVNETGTGQCFDLKTGKDLWGNARVGAKTWSSMIYADGRLYVATDAGVVHVLAASPKFELLATNVLSSGERITATIAVSNGEFFIRSDRYLWCISAKK
jgi:outer membrane protein assembly factor BamB